MSIYPSDSYSGYRDYSLYGGLPYVASLKKAEDKIKYLNNILNNTYLKGIIERNNLKGDIVIDTLVDIYAQIQQLLQIQLNSIIVLYHIP